MPRRNKESPRCVCLPGTPTHSRKTSGAKSAIAKSSQQFSVDVPGLFFGAIMIVFVLTGGAVGARHLDMKQLSLRAIST